MVKNLTNFEDSAFFPGYYGFPVHAGSEVISVDREYSKGKRGGERERERERGRERERVARPAYCNVLDAPGIPLRLGTRRTKGTSTKTNENENIHAERPGKTKLEKDLRNRQNHLALSFA